MDQLNITNEENSLIIDNRNLLVSSYYENTSRSLYNRYQLKDTYHTLYLCLSFFNDHLHKIKNKRSFKKLLQNEEELKTYFNSDKVKKQYFKNGSLKLKISNEVGDTHKCVYMYIKKISINKYQHEIPHTSVEENDADIVEYEEYEEFLLEHNTYINNEINYNDFDLYSLLLDVIEVIKNHIQGSSLKKVFNKLIKEFIKNKFNFNDYVLSFKRSSRNKFLFMELNLNTHKFQVQQYEAMFLINQKDKRNLKEIDFAIYDDQIVRSSFEKDKFVPMLSKLNRLYNEINEKEIFDLKNKLFNPKFENKLYQLMDNMNEVLPSYKLN